MWKYEQSTGKLFDSNGLLIGQGYAGGNCGKNPEGVNNPDMQNVACVGPLPVGIYIPGEPMNHPKLGPFAIPLMPAHDNEMFGRGGFYCHGDTAALNHSASEGCIIMPRNIRQEFHANCDRLQVVKGD